MSDINKVVVIGRLGDKPNVVLSPNGKYVGNFSVANKDYYNNQEKTYWFNVVVFGRNAQNCEKYLNKGSQVAVSGRLVQEKWEDKSGQKRSMVKIIAEEVEFLGGNKNGNNQEPSVVDQGITTDIQQDKRDADIPFS